MIPYSTIYNFIFKLFLKSLRNKVLSGPCTRDASSIVDCADYLLRHIGGLHE